MAGYLKWALLALALVLGAGCGGGSNGASRSDPEAIAREALLQLSDFPTGWTEQQPDDDDDSFDLDPEELPEECRAFARSEEFPGTVAEVDSLEFVGPEDESIESSVTVFTDSDAGDAAFAMFNDFFEQCRDPFLELFTGYLEDLAAQEGTTEIGEIAITELRFDRLSFPQYGDQTGAFQFGATIGVSFFELTFEVDLILIGVNRVASSLTFTSAIDSSNDPDEEKRLAAIAEERLREALDKLD